MSKNKIGVTKVSDNHMEEKATVTVVDGEVRIIGCLTKPALCTLLEIVKELIEEIERRDTTTIEPNEKAYLQ